MEEILSLVLREIRKAGVADILTGGIVLTGGGSLLPGAVDLAEQIFGTPARLGHMRGVESTPEDLHDARFAVAHGLLIYGFEHEPIAVTQASGLGVAPATGELDTEAV